MKCQEEQEYIIKVCGDNVKYIPKPDFIEINVLEYIVSIIKYIVEEEI